MSLRTTNEFGEVESESTSDKNIPATKLTFEYDKRDKYGNVEHVTAKDALGHVRESSTIFDGEGVFPVKEINALGHETNVEYDAAFGVLKKETDPNQLVTEWKYDSLGRETLEKRPDGSQTTTSISRTKVGGAWQLSERTTTTGGADDEAIFDGIGRPIRTFSHGATPEGQQGKTPRRMAIMQYDRMSGILAKTSVPTAEGTPDDQLLFDVSEFDSIGREIRHTTPWNATNTTTYDGFVIDSTDPLLQHTISKIDALGRPVTITDAAKGITAYSYGPFNRLHTVTDPGGATTIWTRDALGQTRSIEEPDRGTTLLSNDGFGELLTSTDALGRVVTFGFDALGRVETRTDKLGAQVSTTTWKWDTAPNGIGKLHTLTSPDAIQSFSYTKRGQLEGMAQTVEGKSFAARRQYDDVGHVKSMDYPQPLGEEPFGVMYKRDEHGFVIGVREKNTQEAFWTLKEVDAAGRYAEESFGNGTKTVRGYDKTKQALKSITTTFGATKIQDLSYEWNERLNLKSRTDALQLQNKTEWFRNDELDRVTCAYFGAAENANAPCATSYSYQANGNLWEKSDVGTYSYTDPKHPHAVTNVPGVSYGYNAVGNQITRPGGVSVTFTPFDLPQTITQGGKTTSFGYDGDQQRIRKKTPIAETLYFGDIFEQVTSAAGGVEHRFFVHSPERAIAVVTRGGAAPGTQFFHVDHLGSIDAITKEDGSVVERCSYDVYGARRNPIWGGPSIALTSKTSRGFTGHEEDDEFGLVNMKGRIMDPRLGRFTTTDPIIADIFDGQSLNKYSYVNGNPLAFVDPTGFEPDEAAPKRNEPVMHVPETFVIGTRPQWAPKSDPLDPLPAKEAAQVGASAPPVDVNTTGNGGDGLPKETAEEKPSPAPSVADGIWDGIGDGLHGVWKDWTTPIWEPASDMYNAYRHGNVVDAFNVVNPLIPVANLSLAIDDGDTYSVTRQFVAIGVTVVVGVVVGKLAEGLESGGKTERGPPEVKEVRLPGGKYPASARHIRDAQAAGHLAELTIDRPGAPARRTESLAGYGKVPGMDLDEYPPAMFKEGGKGASIRPVPAGENRGAGACIGNQCRAFPNGTRVKIIVE